MISDCYRVLHKSNGDWYKHLASQSSEAYAKKNKAVQINTVITEFYIAQLHSSESSVVYAAVVVD